MRVGILLWALVLLCPEWAQEQLDLAAQRVASKSEQNPGIRLPFRGSGVYCGMKNDARRAGQLALAKQTFGPHSRFAVAPVHTRFDAVEWFVWDAEQEDEITERPAVVAQASTREAAMEAAMNLVAE